MFEFGSVYRYEKSGVVHGLTRVRGLTMDDAHIFVTEESLEEELGDLLDFVLGLLGDFGLTDFYLELSTRDDDSEKFVGSTRFVGEGHQHAGLGCRKVRIDTGS
jgi:threonyl-tRNA synthetase